MKIKKIAFWLSTGLLTALMCFSVYNYFFNHEAIVGFFEAMGYPTYIIYPLGHSKNIGLSGHLGQFFKMVKGVGLCGVLF